MLVVFSTFLIFSSLILILMVTRPNPVIAILYLILFLFNITFLLVYLGLDYIGLLFLLLYAGALPILFLFVTMLIDIRQLGLQKTRYSVLLVTFFFILELLLLCFWFFLITTDLTIGLPRVQYIIWTDLFYAKDIIHSVGHVLFEKYCFQFVVLGFFLLFLMIIVINLLLSDNKRSANNLFMQLNRNASIRKAKINSTILS